MGYTYYCVKLLVPPTNPLTFDNLAFAIERHLENRAPGLHEVIINLPTITVKRDNWLLRVHWEDNPEFVAEANEYFKMCAVKHQDRDIISSCNRHISTAGDPDPQMDYFNDYIFVLEVLDKLENVFKFDPYDGRFLEHFEKDA